jgi:hypothetical protein
VRATPTTVGLIRLVAYDEPMRRLLADQLGNQPGNQPGRPATSG